MADATTYDVARLKMMRLGMAPMTFGEAITIAIGHARPMIVDDAATDPTMVDQLAHVDRVMDAATWTPEDLAAVAAVVAVGADYMAANGYAEDEDFPEDAAAARFLEYGDRAISLVKEVAPWFLSQPGD
jgi:hypothetical protein